MAENEIITQQNTAYEISFLQKSEDVSAVKNLLQKFGGVVLKERPIIKVRLAYPIKKEANAFFGIVRFEMPGERVRDLRAAIRLDNLVIRALVAHAKKEDESAGVSAGGDGRERRRAPRRAPSGPKEAKSGFVPALSNEAIEKKIEEILQ